MGKIVAIGGGSVARLETLEIDKYIVSLTNLKKPKLLFIPTASLDDKTYIENIKNVYENNLNCIVDTLELVNNKYSDATIKEKILNSDIIYVGGGNTKYMMKLWSSLNVDKYLHQAYEKGIVMSGLSAGCICWFIAGHSDSEVIEKKEGAKGIWVKGLSIIPYLCCVHADEEFRKEYPLFAKDQITNSIMLENQTALSFIDGKTSIIKANIDKKAYILKLEEGNIIKEEIK